MSRLSGSRCTCNSFLVCFAVSWLGLVRAQEPFFADVLGSNSELWKSFQQEMQTLEAAAHRVNNLLATAHHPADAVVAPSEKVEDMAAGAAEETPADVTVLTSPDVFRNGIRMKPTETKTEEPEKKLGNSENGSPLGGTRQPSTPHLNLNSFINSFGFFKNLPEPWWKGKNVCVEKSEKVEEKQNGEKEEDKHIFIMGTGTFEHCKQTSSKYICTTVINTPQSTKTVSTTYQCCEGSRREANGCVQGEDRFLTPANSVDRDSSSNEEPEYLPNKDAVPQTRLHSANIARSPEDSFSSHSNEGNVELKNVMEVLDSVGCKDFASLLKSQQVMGTLANQNITVFAPIDEAMRSLQIDFQESNQIQARRRRAVDEWGGSETQQRDQPSLTGKDIALSHITASLLNVDDFTSSGEMVVKSLFNDSPLRVNIYPGIDEPVMTVNCARLTSWDHLGTHARVHTVDRILEPVTRSVLDILAQSQFSQFRQYLVQEGLLDMLANLTAVTVFAPNNEAWDKLGEGLRDKYSRGEACIDRVLRHHILPLTLCAASTSDRVTTGDLDNELVKISRDQDGQLMVDEKGRVIQEDIVATNGVVHVLDKVLTPKSAKPLSELLVTSNHSEWLRVVERAGMMDELNQLDNVTVLVPTERALNDATTRDLLDSMDSEALRQVVRYHIAQHAPGCTLRDQARLRTQTGADLRVAVINPFGMFSGLEPRAAVQCVPLGLTNGKACHVVAHEVTQLLLPPNSTVLQLLNGNSQLTLLKQVIEGTQLEKDLEEKSEVLSDGFTLLAPNDEAFNKLDDEVLSKLLTDKKFADEVLRVHLLREPVCCASITSMPWPFTNSVRTLDGRKVQVNRDRRNRVVFGNSAAEKCDVIATDGILHVVDKVLLPEASKVKLGNIVFGSPEKKIMLFGI